MLNHCNERCKAVAFGLQTCCLPRAIGKVFLRRVVVAALVYPIADTHRFVQKLACLGIYIPGELLFFVAVGAVKAGIPAVAVGLQGVLVVIHGGV